MSEETVYEVNTAAFRGPIATLLELIEGRQMEIAELSLAEVTEDFLRHLHSLSAPTHSGAARERMRLLADFLSVASHLLLIKSKSLLPGLTLTEEEETGIHDLENRLKLYRALRPAMRRLNNLWRDGQRLHSRPYFLGNPSFLIAARHIGGETICFPGARLDTGSLHTALSVILDSLASAVREEEVVSEKVVSLEEEIQAIVRRIENAGNTSLKTLAKDRSRAETIIVFLALLHLARDQAISLRQDGATSDILVEPVAKAPDVQTGTSSVNNP